MKIWNVSNIRRLGWLSLAIGATEILATRQLQQDMGIDEGGSLIRAFGGREIAAGVTILAQPGLNRTMVSGLWARLAGDVLDLLVLRRAASISRRPQALSLIMSIVLAVTGIDAFFALWSEWELDRGSRIAKAARMRVRPTSANPKQVSRQSEKRELVAADT